VASHGQVAYEAYVKSCGGKSIRGEDLPSWQDQAPAIRAHWEAAGRASADRAGRSMVVSETVLYEVMDLVEIVNGKVSRLLSLAGGDAQAA
jgi:hypothetical protein